MKIPTTPEELVEFLKDQELTAIITEFKLDAPTLGVTAFGLMDTGAICINIELSCNPPETETDILYIGDDVGS